MFTPSTSSESTSLSRNIRRRRIRITALTVITGLLFLSLFALQAFDTLKFLRPGSASEALIFFGLSTFNFTAFVVLLMILARQVIKLRRDQQVGKLGARFKTRLIVFFLALSLLPVLFLFLAFNGFINRSIDKWFSLPSDEIVMSSSFIETNYLLDERNELHQLAATLARGLLRAPAEQQTQALAAETETQNLVFAQLSNDQGTVTAESAKLAWQQFSPEFHTVWQQARAQAQRGTTNHHEISLNLNGRNATVLIAAVPTATRGALVIAQELSRQFTESISRIREYKTYYESLKDRRRFMRRISLQTLALITLLTMFIAFWLAQYIARTIADPVRQLGEATMRIRQGDLSVRTGVIGDDELAQLAQSFDEMTAQLADNRRNLEERRNYIETLLQNLSAGVISLDEANNITTINPAAQRMLHLDAAPTKGSGLEVLLPEEQREELRRMIRRAARLNSVTREVHFTLANQIKLDAGVTVTTLRDNAENITGTVILFEDLSELIEAQRRAAWSEVARRMAHEIKNPLTPIRLSAERLAKKLLGSDEAKPTALDQRQTQMVRECTSLISTEVETLQRMVDEFSTFARLPQAQLEPTNLNEIVTGALKLYDERLNNVRLETRLAQDLPPALLDAEQIKRVLVNLIDNAAEAMNNAPNSATPSNGSNGTTGERRIVIATRELLERDALELTITDTGPGIARADRERIFDPYFSTRKRGTGLGLAIVSRIIAEHQGRIRVSENLPHGARFTIELPLNP